MIKLEKDSNGIININNLNVNLDCLDPFSVKYRFVLNDKLYYFKSCGFEEIFNEIFACEFADKFNYEHAHYDVASLGYNIGVLSTSVYDLNEEFIPLGNITKFVHVNPSYINTIESMDKKILPKLCPFKKKEELIKYIRMFVFDILLANDDRHLDNAGFIKKGIHYRIAPLFDNGLIVSDTAINNQIYAQGVSNDLYDCYNNYVIEEFLCSKYSKILVEELNKLSFEDLFNLVKDINANYKYKFDLDYETDVLDKLNTNLDNLNKLKRKYY